MLSHTIPTADPCVILSEDGTGATLHFVRPCDVNWPDGTYEVPTADTPPCPDGQTFRPENRGTDEPVCAVAQPASFAAADAPAELPATGTGTSVMLVAAVALVGVGSLLKRAAIRS